MKDEEVLSEEDVVRHVEEQEQLRRNTDRAFVCKCLVFIFVISLVILIIMIKPVILRSHKKMDMTQAISNSKQVYLVLMDFEADYGHFPDDDTSAFDAKLHDFHGAVSNDYLGQLIASEHTKSEEIFYAYDKRFKPRGGDDVIAPPLRILEKNECGFSYVMVDDKGKRRGLETSDNGGLPILVAPLVNEWGSCDHNSYTGRGVYLRVDGSARSERLRSSDQKLDLGGGITLFESGPSTIWGDLKPVVLLPER